MATWLLIPGRATAEGMHIWFALSLTYCAGRSPSVAVGDAAAEDRGALFLLGTVILGEDIKVE